MDAFKFHSRKTVIIEYIKSRKEHDLKQIYFPTTEINHIRCNQANQHYTCIIENKCIYNKGLIDISEAGKTRDM